MSLRTTSLAILVVAISLTSSVAAQKPVHAGSGRNKLLGAWHLVSIESPDPDGKLSRITDCRGQLIYTRDGHMSVQLMYPPSLSTLSNDYVLNGYEASYAATMWTSPHTPSPTTCRPPSRVEWLVKASPVHSSFQTAT